MTSFADAVLDARQVLARGQVADAVTGQPLSGYTVHVDCRIDAAAAPVPLPVIVNHLPQGWFAAWLVPGRLPAALAEAAAAEVTVHVGAAGHAAAHSSQTVDGSHFALQQTELEHLPGLWVRRLSSPPLHFGFRLVPDPVALRGIVIYEHDPALPVPNASVSAEGVTAVLAGPDGRYAIARLPPVQILQVAVSDGATTQTHHVAIDYNQPVNVATLSLPQVNVENDHG